MPPMFLQYGLGISWILWLVFMFCLILMALEFCPGNSICWDGEPFIHSMKLLISVNFFGSFFPANRLLRPAPYKGSHMIPVPWFSYVLPIVCCQSPDAAFLSSAPHPGVTLGFPVFSRPFVWNSYFHAARNWQLSQIQFYSFLQIL